MVALLGYGYRSAAAVLVEKWYPRMAESDSDRLRSGRHHEPEVIRRWLERYPEYCTIAPVQNYSHPEYGWQSARPDRFVYRAADVGLEPGRDYPATEWRQSYGRPGLTVQVDGQPHTITHRPLGVVEAKSHNARKGREYSAQSTGWCDRQHVPCRDWIQTHWTMDVCGVERGWLAVLYDTHEFTHYTFRFDPARADHLRALGYTWLIECVIPRRTPDQVTCDLSYRDIVDARHPPATVGDHLAPHDDRALELVEILGRAHAAIAHAERVATAARTALQAHIGDAYGMTTPDYGPITWKQQRGSVKLSGVIGELAAMQGLDADAVQKIREKYRGDPIRVFRVHPKLKAKITHEPTSQETSDLESALAAQQDAEEAHHNAVIDIDTHRSTPGHTAAEEGQGRPPEDREAEEVARVRHRA
jgi:hypothetical protein